MKRRGRLVALLTILVLLVVVSLWLAWSAWHRATSADDLIGKWLPDDSTHATFSFYRSGDCELSWPAEGEDAARGPVTATGTWELKGRRLFIEVSSGSSPSFQPLELLWDISISGNELTYHRPSLDMPAKFTLRRAPPEPGKSFDVLSPPSFVGSSKGLQRTVIVPTLETPMPAGKSAIWCATLALAWQQMEKELGQGPVVLEGAEGLSRALGSLPDLGLLPDDHYLAAGAVRDGIVERIHREMAQRFPGVAVPDLGVDDPRQFLAYAYLRASVRYQFAFKDSLTPLKFTDSQCRSTPVRAFGIRPEDMHMGEHSFRGQVRVLFREGKDFGVDLSKGTQPYQVVVARMERRDTLRQALEDLEERVASAGQKKLVPELGEGAILLVPKMDSKIEHRFEELSGKKLLRAVAPPESVLQAAHQLLQFKMDRHGAVLESHARVIMEDGADPEDFRLDRPFLLLLRKRDHRLPFFVMWVDNTELLQPR
jgi:hypothetical protein